MVEQNAPHGQQSNPRIAPDDVPVYKALHNPKELAEYVQTLRTNAGVDLLDNLPRCTLPPHGVKEWSIEASEGSRVQETIRGIIVKVLTPRAMWSASPGDDDEKPHPVCSSPDGIRGAGDPGGDCLSCPFNAEDSAPSGTGRACKEKRVLYGTFLILSFALERMAVRPTVYIPLAQTGPPEDGAMAPHTKTSTINSPVQPVLPGWPPPRSRSIGIPRHGPSRRSRCRWKAGTSSGPPGAGGCRHGFTRSRYAPNRSLTVLTNSARISAFTFSLFPPAWPATDATTFRSSFSISISVIVTPFSPGPRDEPSARGPYPRSRLRSGGPGGSAPTG